MSRISWSSKQTFHGTDACIYFGYLYTVCSKNYTTTLADIAIECIALTFGLTELNDCLNTTYTDINNYCEDNYAQNSAATLDPTDLSYI